MGGNFWYHPPDDAELLLLTKQWAVQIQHAK
jgi:hypothetical protein